MSGIPAYSAVTTTHDPWISGRKWWMDEWMHGLLANKFREHVYILITVYLLKPPPIIVPLFNAESDMIFDVNFDSTLMVLML